MPKPFGSKKSNSPSAPARSESTASERGAALESKPTPGKRRVFTAAEKLRIVREAEATTERGGIEALLRREGIYSSLLANWRSQLAIGGSDALVARKPGRKPKHDAKASSGSSPSRLWLQCRARKGRANATSRAGARSPHAILNTGAARYVSEARG